MSCSVRARGRIARRLQRGVLAGRSTIAYAPSGRPTVQPSRPPRPRPLHRPPPRRSAGRGPRAGEGGRGAASAFGPTAERVSCIIPVYNEALRIGGVLAAVVGHSLIAEVIVVDDASTDDTASIAGAFAGLKLLPPVGRAHALTPVTW